MYDPRIGRFTQTELIIANKASAHYSYAGNNPVSKTDPSGLQELTAEEAEGFQIVVKTAAPIIKDTLKRAFVEGDNPYYRTAKAYKDFATTPGTKTTDVLHDAYVEGVNPYRQAYVSEQQRLVDAVSIHLNAGDSWQLAFAKTTTVLMSDALGGTKVAEAVLEKDSNTRFLLSRGVPRHLPPEEVFERGVNGTLEVFSNALIGASALNYFRFRLSGSNKVSLGPGAAAPEDPAFSSNNPAWRSIDEGGFRAGMDAEEAARYDAYWQRGAPYQVTPGVTRLDVERVSGRTGAAESSRAVYDDYGRLKYRVDRTDHLRPESHSNPHLHEFEYGKGYDPHKETKFDLKDPTKE
jgi:hypothetical protein